MSKAFRCANFLIFAQALNEIRSPPQAAVAGYATVTPHPILSKRLADMLIGDFRATLVECGPRSGYLVADWLHARKVLPGQVRITDCVATV